MTTKQYLKEKWNRKRKRNEPITDPLQVRQYSKWTPRTLKNHLKVVHHKQDPNRLP